jgi:hypothetical protein
MGSGREILGSEGGLSPTMKFMDTRQWIALLEKAGELRRIAA